MKLYVRGKPTIITIDDIVPFMNSGPFAARPNLDGSLWGMVLEKAYAKMVGNYEIIANGW